MYSHVNVIKKEIDQKLKSMFNREDLSQEGYNAMVTKDKTPGKFYELFKVHKEHTHPNLPPVDQ